MMLALSVEDPSPSPPCTPRASAASDDHATFLLSPSTRRESNARLLQVVIDRQDDVASSDQQQQQQQQPHNLLQPPVFLTPHKAPAARGQSSGNSPYWEYTPIQYKASLWVAPLYGIAQIGLLILLGGWCWRHLPLPVCVGLVVVLSILSCAYMRWQFSIVHDLEEDSVHAKPAGYELINGHIHVTIAERPSPATVLMSRPMSRADTLWYFLHITINFQLNSFCRIGRTIHGIISELCSFGTLCHGDHQQNYWYAMNSSLHRWMQNDGHLHFPQATLPIVDPARTTTLWHRFTDQLRGNSVRTFAEIRMELDHDSHQLIAIQLDDVRLDDPYECMVMITMVQGLYSHPQVHLIAGEVHGCVDWPLAHEASNAANGLNRAAVMAIGPVITRHHEDYITIPGRNLVQGTPHPKGGRVHQLLVQHSHTYRMMLRAHKDPLVRQYARGDPILHASLIHSSLLHGVDHLLPDLYAPFWLRSATLGSNFTGTLLFGASVNIDFTTRFAKPQDELTRRLYTIALEEAPILAPGWQWAVAQ